MIDLIIDKRTRDLGGSFEVGRVLPFAKRRMVGPFIFFNQMGQVDFGPGKGDVRVTAQAPSTVMVLGGEPIGERFIFGNFVSSSKTRLKEAKEDWKQGRMKLPDGDDQEFTPLPEG